MYCSKAETHRCIGRVWVKMVQCVLISFLYRFPGTFPSVTYGRGRVLWPGPPVTTPATVTPTVRSRNHAPTRYCREHQKHKMSHPLSFLLSLIHQYPYLRCCWLKGETLINPLYGSVIFIQNHSSSTTVLYYRQKGALERGKCIMKTKVLFTGLTFIRMHLRWLSSGHIKKKSDTPHEKHFGSTKSPLQKNLHGWVTEREC